MAQSAAEQRSRADKVLRRLAHALAVHGFRRTKPTYFVRRRGVLVEFLHVHKYSFGPKFRMHMGLRVVTSPKDSTTLNGPASDNWRPTGSTGCGRHYELRFHRSDESVERCAQELAAFAVEVAEPWFQRWLDPVSLLGAESPLSVSEQLLLREALKAGATEASAATVASLGAV